MSDYKRFIVDDAGTLIDIETRDMYDIVEEVVDLLNKFEDITNQYYKHIKELEKENKQLQKDATTLVYSNIDYRKENEHLKKELKRCKEWLNDDKNDYELTLAFIKHKGYSLKDVLEYEKGDVE